MILKQLITRGNITLIPRESTQKNLTIQPEKVKRKEKKNKNKNEID